MSIERFKIGDKVVVRHDLEPEEYYDNVYCNSKMAAMGGKYLTIKGIDKYCYDTGAYEVRECGCVFNDEMLDRYNMLLDMKLCCSREDSEIDTDYTPATKDDISNLYGGK